MQQDGKLNAISENTNGCVLAIILHVALQYLKWLRMPLGPAVPNNSYKYLNEVILGKSSKLTLD